MNYPRVQKPKFWPPDAKKHKAWMRKRDGLDKVTSLKEAQTTTL